MPMRKHEEVSRIYVPCLGLEAALHEIFVFGCCVAKLKGEKNHGNKGGNERKGNTNASILNSSYASFENCLGLYSFIFS